MKLRTLVAIAFTAVATFNAARDAAAQSYPACMAFDTSEGENLRQGLCMAASGPRQTATTAADAYCDGAISCEHGSATNYGHCRVARAACLGHTQAGFLDFGKKPTLDSIWTTCVGAGIKVDEPIEGSGRVRALTCFHRSRAALGLEDSNAPKPWSCRSQSWSQDVCHTIKRLAPGDHRRVVTDPTAVPRPPRLPEFVFEVPVTITAVPLDTQTMSIHCQVTDRGSEARDRPKLERLEAAIAAIDATIAGLLTNRDLTDAERVVERERLTREKSELIVQRDERADLLARRLYDSVQIGSGRTERLVSPGGTFTGTIPVLVSVYSTVAGRYTCEASLHYYEGQWLTQRTIGHATGDLPLPTVRPVDRSRIPKAPLTPTTPVVPGK